MTILLDTNVLVSLANPTDTHHSLTVETIQGLRSQKIPMRLVKHHASRGKISHDARIVTAMHIHQAQQIITYNGADFKRFSGIQPLHPENLKALEG